jgi:hypothetical protein
LSNQFYLKFLGLLNEPQIFLVQLPLASLVLLVHSWKQPVVNYVFDEWFPRFFGWQYLYYKHEELSEQLGLMALLLGCSLLVKLMFILNFRSF